MEKGSGSKFHGVKGGRVVPPQPSERGKVVPPAPVRDPAPNPGAGGGSSQPDSGGSSNPGDGGGGD